ncbi:MAG TPA: hypothetical protein VF587_06070 [Solirubrobacteraceae bacterium]|jgi:hypothetical protein
MTSLRHHLTTLAALLGGAAYIVLGAIQATHEFEGSHNTLDTTAEYIVTGGFGLALFLTAPAYRVLGALADRPRVGVIAMVPQLVIGVMCVISVLNGADPSFFNAVAPVCILTWLVSSIVLGVRLRRSGAVPAAVAVAVPALLITTIGLSVIGGAMITGAFWMAVASHVLREGRAAQPALA